MKRLVLSTRDQAAWRRKEEEHTAKYNELRASHSRELQLRENAGVRRPQLVVLCSVLFLLSAPGSLITSNFGGDIEHARTSLKSSIVFKMTCSMSPPKLLVIKLPGAERRSALPPFCARQLDHE
jgi:hypothetical protein